MTTETFLFPAPGRRSGVAVWRCIADTLADDIRNRRFAEDGRLPSEAELAARFGVNRHTLRQAVHALQDQGLVRVERGRGMFVQHERLPYTIGRRTRFSENLQRQGLLPVHRLLVARDEVPSARVADALKLACDERVLRLENLSEAGGQPLSMMTAWYPAARFPGLLEVLQQGGSTTDVLRRCGVADYTRAESRVTAQLPGEETARLLGLPATRPLLCVESVDVDTAGRPVKFGETLFCGDRVQLVVQMEDAA